MVLHDWVRYWRSADQPVEAMHAHFERHVYHRHSHETYSLGVTDDGAQSFTCRGSAHTSGAGMVMTFNPDDPHDGWAGDTRGFTYRMIHIGPALVAGILEDMTGRPAGLPLFPDPVVTDPRLAGNLLALHSALLRGAPALRQDELLAAAVGSAVRRAARTRLTAPDIPPRGAGAIASRARALIRERYADDITAGDVAAAAGCSRFAIYRAFRSVYGMSPTDYQRQLRLRGARHLIARGVSISQAAAQSGFADQSHLTRWFTRYYGITPACYRKAGQ